MSKLERREFLAGAATLAAAATVTLAEAQQASAAKKPPRPIRGDKGAPDHWPDEPLTR
jgi:hypothetical protein